MSDGAYDAWEDLTEIQQLSLLLLCATPGKLSLPNPDAVSTTLGRWLTGVLDSFITQPCVPTAGELRVWFHPGSSHAQLCKHSADTTQDHHSPEKWWDT